MLRSNSRNKLQMMDRNLENTTLLYDESELDVVKLKSSIVIPFSYSSKYSSSYSKDLQGILTAEDINYVVERVNDSIQSNKACVPIQFFSYGCCICTLGLSLLLQKICIADIESSVNETLEQISLTSKYYDRNISFRIEKGLFTSRIAISFPKKLKMNDFEEDIKYHEDRSYYSSSDKKGY